VETFTVNSTGEVLAPVLPRALHAPLWCPWGRGVDGQAWWAGRKPSSSFCPLWPAAVARLARGRTNN